MKILFHMCSLLLVVSLGFYGSTGMAHDNGATFALVICADGGTTSVVVDSDGNPVEPSQSCRDCVVCCDVVGTQPDAIRDAGFAVLVLVSVQPPMALQTPFILNKNSRPMPRGPPELHVQIPAKPDLISRDHEISGHKTRSDGRLLVKDANA